MILFSNNLLLNIFIGTCALVQPLTATEVGSHKIAQKEWENFTAKESGFSIKLPKKPEHIEQKVDIPKTDLKIYYDTYVSEPSDQVVYVVSVWKYPAEIDMSKPEVNLKDGFGGMLSALPGSEVKSMEMKEIQGHQALEFCVKNENIFFQGQLILVHNTLYQVFAVYKEGEEINSDYKSFINSFKLIGPEKQKLSTKNGKLSV